MDRFKRSRILLAVLFVSLSLAPAVRPSRVQVQTAAQTGSQANESFKFTDVDRDLLQQVKLLDKRFAKEGLVYYDEGLDAYLDRVGKSVLPANSRLENVEWHFRVLRDPTPNAIALPNGTIYINIGLLSVLDNEAQLAGVLAHEVTHVSRRHTYLQNRSMRKKILAINIINTVGFWNPVGGAAGLAIGVIATVSPLILATSIFGYTRELEREADLDGLDRLSEAGYSPQEMVNTFKLLKKDIEGEQLNSFYSDHPKLEERITYVSRSTAAKASTTASKTGTKADYLSRTEQAARHNVELAIGSGRFRTAVFVSQRLVDFNPSSENVFSLAESYRTLGPRAPELTEKELTTGARKQAAKKKQKLTLEEEEAALLLTSVGQENWKSNQQRAEKLYQRALELDNANYAVHRGLGMLYEKSRRRQEAIDEYLTYLKLSPQAPDREKN